MSVSTQATWGPWSDWSQCPALCGQIGVQLRSRSCQSHSSLCMGPKVEGKECQGPECPELGRSEVCFCAMGSIPGKIWKTQCNDPTDDEPHLILLLECHLQCTRGRVNAECDACMCEDHILLGSVRGAGGLTAVGAAILRSAKLLTITDHNGHFRVPGICPDGNTTLTVNLQGHAALSVAVPFSTEHTSVLSVQLKRTGTVHICGLAKPPFTTKVIF